MIVFSLGSEIKNISKKKENKCIQLSQQINLRISTQERNYLPSKTHQITRFGFFISYL